MTGTELGVKVSNDPVEKAHDNWRIEGPFRT